ncbi:hemerythrin domain-containing protein [Flavobacteriaceae bacterium XHP0103]|uniref:hemerythrin domain-containing protein n=1 Tax=Marixanthotalea marina TaxID=2844359 RepID=UPI002989ED26|nr:hemerythrin domain-containing protein [Marixanthotalea marina]MBU3822482.1 hemerythrin domain-containing protein [Marixanthotalea marina]
MSIKPLKRHKALQPLSREHHHGLLLAWKIRSGLNKNIAIERIKAYTDWFFKTHLIPHFEMEEKHIFTLLGNDNDLVKKALSEHKRLAMLFNQTEDTKKNLSLIEEELEQHIRFEERVLFPEIQKIATPDQFAEIEEIHQSIPFKDKVDDEFWK